ncbi:Protein-lysine N-methyltransferase efm4 [Parahypoxylon ruwenzoriense]
MSKPAHLEPSELGTKEYWDKLYANEISNHAHDPSDTGTVWFDDSDAEAKLIEFLSSSPDLFPSNDSYDNTSFLDLGTGNGSLLFGLRDAGWRGPMLGVDYSSASVEFARRIASSRSSSETISFLEHDILHSSPSALLSPHYPPHGWDVVLDKGTFDAISLSSETDSPTGRRVSESYKPNILPLVSEGGLFLVTSCNWTEDELRSWFEGGDSSKDEESKERKTEWGFQLVGRVAYPSFSFGGVKGQTISSLCFRKVKNPRS